LLNKISTSAAEKGFIFQLSTAMSFFARCKKKNGNLRHRAEVNRFSVHLPYGKLSNFGWHESKHLRIVRRTEENCFVEIFGSELNTQKVIKTERK
jgi:hypothetical protein